MQSDKATKAQSNKILNRKIRTAMEYGDMENRRTDEKEVPKSVRRQTADGENHRGTKAQRCKVTNRQRKYE